MKPTATSRADLLRCMGRGLEPDEAAGVVGYHRVREDQPAPPPEMPPGFSETHAASPVEPVPAPEIEFPAERPRLTFLMPVRVESLAPPQPRRDRGNPISDAALAVDWSQQGPPLPPLTRWARLAPFLRQRLGSVIPGTALDQRRLMREVGKGLPLVVLPRRPRAAWAAQAVVLWDGTPEMFPFQRDAQDLLRRLKRERGAHGLEVRLLRRLPRRSDAARIPQGVPVIALSAMGQFQQSAAAQEAWLALARRLGFLGQAFHALNPCPRDRWQPRMAAHWPSGVWDRRPRLPRQGGLKVKQTLLSAPAEGTEGQTGVSASLSAADRLLTLLSPASRIEAPLLRTARLALGHAADAGTEWDAWHHEQCWHSLDCFGFHPGADYEARLNQRQALSGREAVLADEIGGLMAAHHAGCSRVIAAEAELRAILSVQKETPQEMGDTQRSESEASSLLLSHVCGVKSLLQSVVDRLRLLAADPGGEEGRQSGLPGWFPGMVERLSESMRANEEVKELIAEGLAYAHAFLETAHVELPSGVDGEVFKVARGEVAKHSGKIWYCWIMLSHTGWHLMTGLKQSGSTVRPIVGLSVSRPSIHLALSNGVRHSYRLPSPPALIPLPNLSSVHAFTLESDRERLFFETHERPKWAKSIYYGRHGLRAEVQLGPTKHYLYRVWKDDLDAWNIKIGKPYTDVNDEVSNPEAEVRHGLWVTAEPPPWATRLWADEYGLAAEFYIRDVPFVLRWVPPGSFLMGSPAGEAGRDQSEGPQHQVEITQGYWIGETQVTQAQWRTVVEEAERKLALVSQLDTQPSYFKGPFDLPVESVSWADSVTFCRLLNALLPDGPDFQLPTEAQWEYACRLDSSNSPFVGPLEFVQEVLSPQLDPFAWYAGNCSESIDTTNARDGQSRPKRQLRIMRGGTHRVKKKAPNALGLFDMLGNVWEWCFDAWVPSAYVDRKSEVSDPCSMMPDERGRRVARGGSWQNEASFCRVAMRNWDIPEARSSNQGLRLSAGRKRVNASELEPIQDRKSVLNFSPRAQQMLAMARKEADRLGNDFVGVEHLVLGLIKLGNGIGWKLLQRALADLEKLRTEMEKLCGSPKAQIPNNIPYTPRVKSVLSLSRKEAAAFGNDYVGTEHILLGVLREGDGPAARVLLSLGLSLDQCHEEIRSGGYLRANDEHQKSG